MLRLIYIFKYRQQQTSNISKHLMLRLIRCWQNGNRYTINISKHLMLRLIFIGVVLVPEKTTLDFKTSYVTVNHR